MQHAALMARCIGAVQQAAWAAYTIYSYFHVTEEHYACNIHWRRAFGNIAYTSWRECYDHNFFNDFWLGAKIMLLV